MSVEKRHGKEKYMQGMGVRTLQKQINVTSKRHVCVMTKMCMSVERTYIREMYMQTVE